MKALSLFRSNANVQVLPSSKGQVILANPLPKTHPTTTLIFLTDLRNENLTAYLEAIACHRFGEAAFLEGGLGGIDVVMHHPAPYAPWQRQGETHLQAAIAHQDWNMANWWKGFVCGLELAAKAHRIAWYKPARFGDRLLDGFDRTRGNFA